jgi:homoserine/homoserine lactone efflux protein
MFCSASVATESLKNRNDRDSPRKNMNHANWLAYLAVVLMATLSPGPAVLLSVSNATAFGARASVFSSLGNVTGLLLLAATSMAGVSAILISSPLLFSALKVVGAGYLVWLGIRQWTAGQRTSMSSLAPDLRESPVPHRLYVQGITVAVTNPKALLFFGALFPQFLVVGEPLLPQVLALAGILIACSFCALMGYALLARGVMRWLAEGNGATWFNRIAGTVFIGLGLALLGVQTIA